MSRNRKEVGTGLQTLRGQPALGPYGSGRSLGHQGDSKEVHVAGVLFSHQVMSSSFVTLWTVAHQAPLSMRFHRQEHWSGLPCPPPGDIPNPGIKPWSLMPSALGGWFFTTSATSQPTVLSKSCWLHHQTVNLISPLFTTLDRDVHYLPAEVG